MDTWSLAEAEVAYTIPFDLWAAQNSPNCYVSRQLEKVIQNSLRTVELHMRRAKLQFETSNLIRIKIDQHVLSACHEVGRTQRSQMSNIS